mgnify:CR=1 FL=1|tara:strand:+ start:577 stop:888 length:312 start_codon:yes stop_codon:yes gene_type:complete
MNYIPAIIVIMISHCVQCEGITNICNVRNVIEWMSWRQENNMSWIKSSERLPKKIGTYIVKHNGACNSNIGEMDWLGTRWDIPDMIKNFYKISYWWEIAEMGE